MESHLCLRLKLKDPHLAFAFSSLQATRSEACDDSQSEKHDSKRQARNEIYVAPVLGVGELEIDADGRSHSRNRREAAAQSATDPEVSNPIECLDGRAGLAFGSLRLPLT
jgi:hypothetical protein